MHTLSLFSCVQIFVTPRTVACQAPLSMGFSHWSGLPLPSPEDLPNPGISYVSCVGRRVLYHQCHLGASVVYTLQNKTPFCFPLNHRNSQQASMCFIFFKIFFLMWITFFFSKKRVFIEFFYYVVSAFCFKFLAPGIWDLNSPCMLSRFSHV